MKGEGFNLISACLLTYAHLFSSFSYYYLCPRLLRQSVRQSVSRSVSLCLSVCLSVFLSFCLSVCLSICQSVSQLALINGELSE